MPASASTRGARRRFDLAVGDGSLGGSALPVQIGVLESEPGHGSGDVRPDSGQPGVDESQGGRVAPEVGLTDGEPQHPQVGKQIDDVHRPIVTRTGLRAHLLAQSRRVTRAR